MPDLPSQSDLTNPTAEEAFPASSDLSGIPSQESLRLPAAEEIPTDHFSNGKFKANIQAEKLNLLRLVAERGSEGQAVYEEARRRAENHAIEAQGAVIPGEVRIPPGLLQEVGRELDPTFSTFEDLARAEQEEEASHARRRGAAEDIFKDSIASTGDALSAEHQEDVDFFNESNRLEDELNLAQQELAMGGAGGGGGGGGRRGRGRGRGRGRRGTSRAIRDGAPGQPLPPTLDLGYLDSLHSGPRPPFKETVGPDRVSEIFGVDNLTKRPAPDATQRRAPKGGRGGRKPRSGGGRKLPSKRRGGPSNVR